MTFALAALANFIAVTLKALQQRHVMGAEYWRMPLVSYGMAFCDVFLMALVIKSSDSLLELLLLVFAAGTGGGAGSIFGTWLHARKNS